MDWTFHLPTRLEVACGGRRRLAQAAAMWGGRAVLVVGGGSLAAAGHLALVHQDLAAAGVEVVTLRVDAEPASEVVDDLAATVRAHRPAVLVAVGGGSVIDAAKALAVLAVNQGRCLDYLEGLPGPGPQPVTIDPLPVIAAPTTAGTGAEVTYNAVIQADGHQVKRSLRDPRLAPHLAVLDAELLASCPAGVMAAAAFDALGHLVESLLSRTATPMTQALAWPGISRMVAMLTTLAAGRRAPQHDAEALLAACWGGICLAHARLGAAHGLVAPLGGLRPVPHGQGIACLLPGTLLVTERALRQRAADSPVRADLTRLCRVIAGDGAGIDACVTRLIDWRHRLGLPGLAAWNLDPDDRHAIVTKPSGSIASHPIALDEDELTEILVLAR